MMRLSIIIPTLNEATTIAETLAQLQPLRQQHEVIVIDGGSTDNTRTLAEPFCDKLLYADQGRANQMNAGAEQAKGDVYLFLHSDSQVPENMDQLIEQHMSAGQRHWGRFNVRLSGHHPLFRLIETLMNLRSCITGVATGDQGIFIRSNTFKQLKGYQVIPLMEDIDISKRLLQSHGRPACIKTRLITSSRRWEQHGVLKTILLMWRLRLAYFLGVHPNSLSKHYSNH